MHLLVAAIYGDVNSAKILFNCTDRCTGSLLRDTPLIIAAKNGHVEVVRVLLEGGANLDKTNDLGCTALHYAAHNGQLDVCRLLLDWGAKVDPLNMSKDTPLHYAAFAGNLSLVKLLVWRGADVSLKNDDGQTACDVARSKGREDVAEWLDSVSRG
jgi:ankyrin repeat protein